MTTILFTDFDEFSRSFQCLLNVKGFLIENNTKIVSQIFVAPPPFEEFKWIVFLTYAFVEKKFKASIKLVSSPNLVVITTKFVVRNNNNNIFTDKRYTAPFDCQTVRSVYFTLDLPLYNSNKPCEFCVCVSLWFDGVRKTMPRLSYNNPFHRIIYDYRELMYNNSHKNFAFFVEGKQIMVDSAIVAQSCIWFDELMKNYIKTATTCHYVKHVRYEIFLKLIEFCYVKQIDLVAPRDMIDAIALFRLGKKYVMPRLVYQCEDFLGYNLASNVAIKVMAAAEETNSLNLKLKCLSFLASELNYTLVKKDHKVQVYNVYCRPSNANQTCTLSQETNL